MEEKKHGKFQFLALFGIPNRRKRIATSNNTKEYSSAASLNTTKR
jgi:hypothetical protein